MSRIHFIGGEKGGIGKSVLSRVLCQYFLDHSLVFEGFDADQSHPTLSRYYGDHTQPINLDEFESTDQIMELALEDERDIVVDLPAQSERFLDRWIDENGVLEMSREMGITLVYWYLVDDGRDSAELLRKFLRRYGEKLHVVVVKNHGRGSDFEEVDDVIGNRNGISAEMDLPALHSNTIHKIDKLNFSFWAASHTAQNKGPQLSMMERQRSKVWLKKAYAGVSSVLASLGLD